MELEIDVDLNGFDINFIFMDWSIIVDEELGGFRSGDIVDILIFLFENGIILKFNIGMEFNFYDDVYVCYEKYVKGVGFGILKIISCCLKIFGYFIDVKFVCIKYGVKKLFKIVNF